MKLIEEVRREAKDKGLPFFAPERYPAIVRVFS
jgi:hypothetical protein